MRHTTPGVSGSLLSPSFLEREIETVFGGRLGERRRAASWLRLKRWWTRDAQTLGPASSLRTMTDRGVTGLIETLGFRQLRDPHVSSTDGKALMIGHGSAPVGLVVTLWNRDLGAVWRDAVTCGIQHGVAWCLAFNGRALRVFDVQRTYARRYVEFDLEIAVTDARSFALFWGLARAEAFPMPPARQTVGSLLDEIVTASDRHRAGICGSLRNGVEQALTASSLRDRPADRICARAICRRYSNSH